MAVSTRSQRALVALAARLEVAGSSLTIVAPGLQTVRVGPHPERTHVIFRSVEALEPLGRGDHLALAQAYLDGAIDIDGDLLQVMPITEVIALDATWLERARLAWRLFFRDRVRYDRESIAFHYDRPPEFFLAWLDRWRSYSHGFYASPDDPIEEAQGRKLQYAIDALGLEPGMDVFDMGAGWGCFVEYAGLQGIRVHAITISKAQHAFVRELIREKDLPCTVELVNLFEYEPYGRFDGAVFMGTFEHVPDYARVARRLVSWLEPNARLYADFCAQRTHFALGAFMKRYIWPGAITYVNPYGLTRELVRAGFNIHELADDTRSYACTVRDWADAFDACRKSLSECFGEREVRAFGLFLRGSQWFLDRNRTQAYHLVAGVEPRPLR